jgi:peptidoglycan/xylan/chitin deacetylase (PgdA/CDA1 family)
MSGPRGHAFTFFLSFDLDVDSAEVLKGEDPVALSRGRFAIRRGLDKVLKMLDMYGVKTTFFVPGWVALRYPQALSKVLEREHEVALHGFLHERLDLVGSYSEERALIKRAVEALEEVTGARPEGFRAPYWRLSPWTLEIIVEEGLLYDSSLMDDEEPYVFEVKGRKIVELPVDWRLDDWVYLESNRCINYRDLLEMWVDEIDYANEVNGYVSITLHPQCIGRGARIRILETLLNEAIKRDAWIPKGSEIAKNVLK